MAIVEKKEAKDWVSIYCTSGEWALVNTFEVDTFDMADLMWCRMDSAILVYDSPLEAKILVYNALTGECVAKHNPGSLGLGIKYVSLSPNSMFLIAAFFDTKIKLFNGISMLELASLEHMP